MRQIVSIPRSGFCLFILRWRPPSSPGSHVSIPRSGFCLFILPSLGTRESEAFGFNPSVGILFVHTVHGNAVPGLLPEFQSLGRDSVCSYIRSAPRWPSLGCSFNPSVGILFVHTRFSQRQRDGQARFNPSVGILFVHTCADFLCTFLVYPCFNPSVGILFVHTGRVSGLPPQFGKFQSLGRDSVCSYLIGGVLS